jgi:hypothetical protein
MAPTHAHLSATVLLFPLAVKTHTVDIKFSAHNAYMEKPSSGALKNRKIGKPNNNKFWER